MTMSEGKDGYRRWTFTGVNLFAEAFFKRPDLFARTVTGKLLACVLVCGVECYDTPVLREPLKQSTPDYHLNDLIFGITKSIPFTHRQKL